MAAIAAYEAGCSVIPVAENKKPFGLWKQFQRLRADEGQIERWLGGDYYEGFGVVCGAVSGNLEMLEFEGRFLKLGINLQLIEDWKNNYYVEKTPNGGLHLYYRCADVSGNTCIATSEEGVLIETRGEGGFSVCAPSGGRTHPSGRAYESIGSWDKVPTITPEKRTEIANMLKSFNTSQKAFGSPTPPDDMSAVEDFNSTHTPLQVLLDAGWTISHSHKDSADVYVVRPGKESDHSGVVHTDTGRFKNFSTSATFPTEGTHNAWGCFVHTRYSGDFSAAARAEWAPKPLKQGFSTEPTREPTTQERADELSYLELLRSWSLTSQQLNELQPPKMLIEDYLVENSFAALYGRPGSGKSFLAISIALHVVSGLPFLGLKAVKPGAVLYVAGEGVAGLAARQRAWIALNRPSGLKKLTWLRQAVDLSDQQWSFNLALYAKELTSSLVVIDTLNRAMPGRDENDSRDMGLLIAGCERIRKVGATVLLVHHTPKDGSTLRGHSALEGALDSALKVEQEAPGRLKLIVAKQKDVMQIADMELKLEPVGDSVVPTRLGHDGFDADEESEALRRVKALLLETALDDGLSLQQLTRDSGLSGITVRRAVKSLSDRGLIKNLQERAKRTAQYVWIYPSS